MKARRHSRHRRGTASGNEGGPSRRPGRAGRDYRAIRRARPLDPPPPCGSGWWNCWTPAGSRSAASSYGCRAHELDSRGRAGTPVEARPPAAPRSRYCSALRGGCWHGLALRGFKDSHPIPVAISTAWARSGSFSGGTTSNCSATGSVREPTAWRSSAPPGPSRFTRSTSPCATPPLPGCSAPASRSGDERVLAVNGNDSGCRGCDL